MQKYFNFSQFKPGQKEIVEAILGGKDVVALMPTGGGKSLCFQLPAIISDKLTVVVSPLIALMKDQVDALNARGIPASFINSSLEQKEISKRLDDLQNKKIKILYVAPERFTSLNFRRIFFDLDIFLFAVDEAHCVSEWGHDFRPDYLEIKRFVETLKKRPIVAAFTATATPEVKEDIIKKLDLKNPQVFVRGFDRPNLKFFVQNNLKPKLREKEAARIIKSLSGSGIVYTLTRKNAESIAKFLNKNEIKSKAYHAGMPSSAREKIQNGFMENKYKVIVATIAFGMGVDKADVRFVIHCGMPKNLEGYYQEAGRAGRDGEDAYCILLHSKQDANTHRYFIRNDQQSMINQGKSWNEINKIINIKRTQLEKIQEYVDSKVCRRKIILKYFSDPKINELKENCKKCDVCLNWKKRETEGKKDNLIVDDELSNTVLETVDLYKKDFTPEKIAKIRSLGLSTIFNHLVKWYLIKGELSIEKFLSGDEEKLILEAIDKANAGELKGLRAIRDLLPEKISYEKIRFTLARLQRNGVCYENFPLEKS